MAWTDELKTVETWKIWAALGGLLVALAGGFWYFSYQPTQDELKQLHNRIEKLDAKIREGQAAEKQRDEFAKEVQRLETKLDHTIAILPQESALDRLVKRVEILATQSALDVRSFNAGRKSKKRVHGVQPINLQFRGKYNDVASFVEAVAKEDRIVNLTDIKLTRAKGDGFPLNASMTAEVFWFIPREVLKEKEKK